MILTLVTFSTVRNLKANAENFYNNTEGYSRWSLGWPKRLYNLYWREQESFNNRLQQALWYKDTEKCQGQTVHFIVQFQMLVL